MSRIKIPIVAPPYPSLDGIELDTNAVSINDGYIDEAGFLVRRPGLNLSVTLSESAPIDGLDYWESQDRLVAVCNQQCYLVDANGNATKISSAAIFEFNNRPTFAYTKIGSDDYMAVANGGKIYLSINGGTLAAVSDVDAPTTVTHLVFSNNRLVANSTGTDVFYWSDFEDPTSWAAGNFASAEGEPDQITALYESWNEIALFGTNTVEFWYNTFDSSSPFARMSGTQLNQGTLSPDGIVFDREDAVWYFIDSERNVNILKNRSAKNISAPIQEQLHGLTDVTDARLDLIKTNDGKFILCTFPSDNITYVYDVSTGYWFQWGEYSTSTSDYQVFLGRSMAWANKRGINYAGSSRSDGQIFTIDSDTYQDDGSEMRTAIRTGWVDAGTHFNKRWKTLLFRIKRQPTTGSSVLVKHRKNAVGPFGNERTIDLGVSSYNAFVKRLNNFGTARNIQFEIYCADNTPFVIGNFELDFVQSRS